MILSRVEVVDIRSTEPENDITGLSVRSARNARPQFLGIPKMRLPSDIGHQRADRDTAAELVEITQAADTPQASIRHDCAAYPSWLRIADQDL